MKLLGKEIQQATGTAAIFTLLIVLWIGYLLTRVNVWPGELALVLSLMTLGFLPFWALWRTYYSLRQEWTGDHMYLLLSLPIPGWYITSTKLLVAMVELLVYAAVIQLGALVIFNAGAASVFPWEILMEPALLWTSIRLSVLSMLMLGMGMVVMQFAYLCGRLVSKRRGLLTLLVGAVSMWLILRLGGLLAPLFKWLPPMPVYGISVFGGEPVMIQTQTAYVGLAPLAGSLLVAVGLFLLGSVLLERDIEL